MTDTQRARRGIIIIISGALVDAQGIHGSVCKQAPSKIATHQAINDVIARAITAAGVPVNKEPVGLARLDGKQPDGLTLIPWQGGKPLTWDVTVVSTLVLKHTLKNTRQTVHVDRLLPCNTLLSETEAGTPPDTDTPEDRQTVPDSNTQFSPDANQDSQF